MDALTLRTFISWFRRHRRCRHCRLLLLLLVCHTLYFMSTTTRFTNSQPQSPTRKNKWRVNEMFVISTQFASHRYIDIVFLHNNFFLFCVVESRFFVVVLLVICSTYFYLLLAYWQFFSRMQMQTKRQMHLSFICHSNKFIGSAFFFSLSRVFSFCFDSSTFEFAFAIWWALTSSWVVVAHKQTNE